MFQSPRPATNSAGISIGRFSGAFYHDVSGITVTSAAPIAVPFIASDKYYDTDLYLQGIFITAPFDGYYRLTGFVYSDQTIQSDYRMELGSQSSTFAVSGHGTAIDGINASYAETFYFAAGTAMEFIISQFSGVDQLMYGWLQADYLGS